MNIKFEEMNESHLERLDSLLNEAAVSKNPFFHKKNLIEQMRKEKDYFKGYVAINEKEELVGYVLFSFAYSIWSGRSVYINKFYIDPQLRQKGIESQLMHRVITYAQYNDFKLVSWDISDKSEAMIRFYEKIGAKVDNVKLNCEPALS
ncbi:MAG: GNAT family N-acetyltransferase [Bacteroides sp.]|nr:GNAT family N-acetyltransferase [Bacteroides sp.]